MTSRSLSDPIGKCSDCGKLRFISRKAARNYMKKWCSSDHLSIYQCGDYWHYGHTPEWIIRGKY